MQKGVAELGEFQKGAASMTEGMEPDVLRRTFIYMTSLQAGREMAENTQEFVKNIKCHKADEEELQEGASEDQISSNQRDTAPCKT